MQRASAVALGLLAALGLAPASRGQQPAEAPAPACADAPAHPRRWPCLDWALACFPRCGCPDDYCPHPYPRQCWPPYPPFYRCVPAGDCGPGGCGGRRDDRLTWWFVPTPRALRDALWSQP